MLLVSCPGSLVPNGTAKLGYAPDAEVKIRIEICYTLFMFTFIKTMLD